MDQSRNSKPTRGSTVAVVVAVCLAVGASALLAVVFAGGAHEDTPRPSAGSTTSASPSGDAQSVSRPSRLEVGQAVADDAAADAATAIEVTSGHDPAGAVEAFVSYATWAVASPAAAEDPLHASQALGGKLNTADAAMVDAIDRSTDHDFVPSEGAYRVLGHSGSDAAPDQVMLEVVAPMTVDGKITWRKIGGVVSWEGDRWLPTSMQPRDVPQPSDPTVAVTDMSAAEQGRVLDGLGWELFKNAASHG